MKTKEEIEFKIQSLELLKEAETNDRTKEEHNIRIKELKWCLE